MRLLALDPASSCGWAYGNTHYVQPQTSGTWRLRKSGQDYAVAVVALRDELTRLLADGVDLIAYEMPIVGARRAGAAKLMWLIGQIEEIACRHAIPTRHFHPGAVKRRATGRIDATKEEMIAAAVHAGASLKSTSADDEADAYWVWRLARDNHGSTTKHSESGERSGRVGGHPTPRARRKRNVQRRRHSTRRRKNSRKT